ncbi:MAG: TetR/AcrR family transcriptional regulator [Pseudomonadota bacterium]|nr:TetR/AcrR family transcriptional regulator [Pseudomonadota bacterium]
MDPGKINGRRRPKGDKRARTRAKLIEAARDLIREKGYERTTMEDVARRAGMTTGAIYGNFKNRNELFIALSETYWPPITPKFKPGSNFAEIMHAFAEATIAAIPERHAAAVGFLTGRAYALSHEEMRVRVRKITAESYNIGAEWLRDVADEDELPMPPETLVRIIHAMTDGLLLQRFLTPELMSDEVFRAAFEALATTQRITQSG